MGMNLLNKAASAETIDLKNNTGERLIPNRALIDDLTLATETHVQARWMLSALEETANWARMMFKPTKSRSLIIRKGKQADRFILKIQKSKARTSLQSLTTQLSALENGFDDSLNDQEKILRIKTQPQEGLRQIDKSGLPGKYKAWLFQHGRTPSKAHVAPHFI